MIDERVMRGDPAGLREFFELKVCAVNKISFEYSSQRNYCAWPARRHVRVPPLVDLTALSIALHEAGHCIVGPCLGTGDHRRTVHGGCVECEHRAWTKAYELCPFTVEMWQRMRSAISTYYGSPSTPQARIAAGSVNMATEFSNRRRMQDRLATVERWHRETKPWRDEALKQMERRRALVNEWKRTRQ